MNSHAGRKGCLCALTVLALAVLTVSPALAQVPAQYIKMSTDGTPVPDVDKVNQSDPNDASCWLASAANLLGAAGYGTGASAQTRAQGIYTQLKAAYGTATGGAPDQAISFWLAAYGKNPDSAEYRPTLAYTDVTAEYRALGATDYAFLKNELYRCQYVGVQFETPSHAVTLVGWDDNLNQSIWHDSDFTIGPGGDDPYDNVFAANPVDWDLQYPGSGINYLNNANGYVTFCPGLNKDPNIVANYDVAYAPSPMGPMAREAGMMVGIYEPVPGWQPTWTDPQDANVSYEPFRIDNEFDPLRQKHVQLLVDFYGRDANYANEDIRLRYLDEFGLEQIAAPTTTEISDDLGQILLTWELEIQPEWEELLFPNYMDYGLLEGKVASWDCATICVPEPTTLVALAVSGLALVRRRRRARG